MTEYARRLRTILDRLGLLLPGEDEIVIHRTRAGYYQRSAGAWSWWASPTSGLRAKHEIAASPWPVRDILKAKRVTIYQNESGIGFQVPELIPHSGEES